MVPTKGACKNFEIAFLGDSFVEGVSLNYENTFVGIFEDKKNISVANLGAFSYTHLTLPTKA